MKPATSSKRHLEQTKLLVLRGQEEVEHALVGALDEYLSAGDLLVVNRSATLPSSFKGKVERTGEEVEIRLAAFQGPSPENLSRWKAFSFGAGDWQVSTEDRGQAPELLVGDRVVFGENLLLRVLRVQDGRLLTVEFESSSLLKNLYLHGRPIQYSYLKEPLEVWDQQTIFAGAPISVEPPSSAFSLTWNLMLRLRKKGVQVATILHSAGISSTGDPKLDALLPLDEWFQVPEETVKAVKLAKENGHRVVAVGTTVLRALESAAQGGKLRATSGLTSLKIGPGYKFKHIDTLLTGMHELGTSHMEILNSFCGIKHIEKGYKQTQNKGYKGHEYGDVSLLDCG